MRQPYVNFRELKAAVPIRSVLDRYGLTETMRERGDSLQGPCPLCDSDTSFRASQERSCFHCFNCRAGGNMLDLVAAMEDCSVRDAAVKVAEWFGVETSSSNGRQAGKGKQPKRTEPPPSAKEKTSAPAPEKAEDAPSSPTGKPGPVPPPRENPPLTFELKLDPDHPWFAEAGLSPETLREFGLGFCARGMMGGRIAFPLRNVRGELVGYAGRWPGDDPPEGEPLWRYPKGLNLDLVVYPAERLADSDPTRVLFASDPLRVALCWQLGVRDVFFVAAGGRMEECVEALCLARG